MTQKRNRGVQWAIWIPAEESRKFDKVIADLGYKDRADWLRDMKRRTEHEHMELKKDA